MIQKKQTRNKTDINNQTTTFALYYGRNSKKEDRETQDWKKRQLCLSSFESIRETDTCGVCQTTEDTSYNPDEDTNIPKLTTNTTRI
jgi:hypothetical protein